MTIPGRHPGTLPAEPTSFVGRHRESLQLVRLLRESRLVTLTGVGGVGKTRLALRVARLMHARFPDGAWLVELSALTDPHLIAHTVVAALRVSEPRVRDQRELLAEHLRERTLLLVLDTCEHLAQACADLIAELLRAAPGLSVLATSRVPLGVPGERRYPVDPLPAADALALLDARAPGHGDSADAALLVTRLEGIPLAIELAAVRLRTLSPTEIVERLDDRFHVLLGGAGEPARHQTLLTAIGWSHELCEPLERLLWARLSVFAGEFDVEAAQTVCGDASLPAAGIAGLLNSLADKSILTRLPEGRFGMLDTLRDYGAEWSRRLGEDGLMRLNHRDFYLGLARQFDDEWFGPNQLAWCRRMRRDLPNLRSAIDLCLTQTAEQDLGLDLVARLGYLWQACGYAAEGRHHLARALSAAGHGGPAPSLHRALWAGAWLANFQGDLDEADDLATECLTRALASGDRAAAGWSTACCAITAIYLGRIQEAFALYERAEALHTDGGDRGAGLAYALIGQAYLHHELGRPEEALAVLARQRRISAEHGEIWLDSYGDWIRALIELDRGNPAGADECARGTLWVKHHLFDTLGMTFTLGTLAGCAAQLGQAERAARLLGIVALAEHTYGLRTSVAQLEVMRKRTEREVRAVMGGSAFATAYMDGFALSIEQAVRYAVEAK
ncbi:ATP-binding protein [Nonomuraea sp. NPDC050328]|uniref:ATP-binding protein n=1 Tax=Nonomuraea sp. NPDC050328 TaxID=3364361 RepID=UPI0037B970D9